MITFLILPLSRPLRASTSRLAPILPRRLADHHLRPYPTLRPYHSPPRQLWVPALPPPIPTYHTSPGSSTSTSTTRLYPTTALWQPFPSYFIRLISPIRPIRLITPIALYPHSPQPPRI